MKDIQIPVTIGGVTFKNPFFVASGPVSKTVRQLMRIEEAGWAAASIKLSIDPAPYINRKPRYDLFEDRDALAFTAEKRLTFQEGLTLVREAKQQLKELKLFANITYAGDDGVAGWVNMAKEFEAAGADIIELNMCCPNMSYNVSLTSAGGSSAKKQTGASLGQQEHVITEIVREIKKSISIPLFVKLTPEGGRIAPIAAVLYQAGADAVGGTGNRLGIPLIDLEHPEKAVYHLQEEISMSCYSGAWLKPLAQRDTYEIRKLCGEDAVIAATGGIRDWRDAVEMVLCGGDLLGVCAEILINGYDVVRPMLQGLKEYMDRHGYAKLSDFRGKIVPAVRTAEELTLYGGYARIIEPKLAGPCKAACPYHVPAQAYVRMVAKGDFQGAYDAITEKGLLQDVCAYVCPHPCEDACVRGAYGNPVRIRELKRYVLEKGRLAGWLPKGKPSPANGHKIAVVGAGSAGMTAAYELAMAGYAVTLFEKRERVGGMLRAFVKEGLLPEETLQRLEERLPALGVTLRPGKSATPERLLADGYEAVVAATGGETDPAPLETEIENAALIQDADALFEASPEDTLTGKAVAVLGGGPYALHAALCAKRAGAKQVRVIGKRLNTRLSGVRELYDEAKKRGVLFVERAALRSIAQNSAGGVVGLTLLGEGDMELAFPCDAAFMAREPKQANAAERGNILVARRGLSGGPNVIGAIAEGARLAAKADALIRGSEATLNPLETVIPAKRDAALKRTGCLPYEADGAAPITTDKEAQAEASRCLNCGCGEGCQLCKTICTDFAPEVTARDRLAIDRDACVACGMCYNRCPNGNIEMVNTGHKV
ncbi:MAG TPA: FAD-dependent oxidoreductase [Feifaniaceae bacterium]|nr:FAD-dependent oxidoreductase [Feifaniaceae bacterium]